MEVKDSKVTQKYADIKELRELGLIHEINRQFLHPLGLALAVAQFENNGTERLIGIWDCRDEAEGVLFTAIDRSKIEKFAAFSKEKHEARKRELGFVVQTGSMPDED